MSLTLHFHPLSSFCQKALVALYENATPFDTVLVDFGNAESRGAFQRLWPIAKMPVLRDEARDATVPEATIVIEYLEQYYPGPAPLIPRDPDAAREARLWDRFYDHYVNELIGKIVTDKLRPAGKNDPVGVESARALLGTALGLVEERMATRTWAIGSDFSLADCAAAPSLYYANRVAPFEATHPHAAAYLGRLLTRPSYARALREAEPYFKLFPG